MPRRKQPVYSVTIEFPAPGVDDEARYVGLVKQLVEIGRPVAERRRELIEQLRVALAANDVMLVQALCRQLCERA